MPRFCRGSVPESRHGGDGREVLARASPFASIAHFARNQIETRPPLRDGWTAPEACGMFLETHEHWTSPRYSSAKAIREIVLIPAPGRGSFTSRFGAPGSEHNQTWSLSR